MAQYRIFATDFSKVYPPYVKKTERKKSKLHGCNLSKEECNMFIGRL